MATTRRYRCCFCGRDDLPAWLPVAQAIADTAAQAFEVVEAEEKP